VVAGRRHPEPSGNIAGTLAEHPCRTGRTFRSAARDDHRQAARDRISPDRQGTPERAAGERQPDRPLQPGWATWWHPALPSDLALSTVPSRFYRVRMTSV